MNIYTMMVLLIGKHGMDGMIDNIANAQAAISGSARLPISSQSGSNSTSTCLKPGTPVSVGSEEEATTAIYQARWRYCLGQALHRLMWTASRFRSGSDFTITRYGNPGSCVPMRPIIPRLPKFVFSRLRRVVQFPNFNRRKRSSNLYNSCTRKRAGAATWHLPSPQWNPSYPIIHQLARVKSSSRHPSCNIYIPLTRD